VHTLKQAEALGVAHRVMAETEGSMYVLQDGKPVHWIVDDPLVSQAISSLSAVPFRGPVMHALTQFKRALTTGVTASPTYRINNVIRDQIAATAANPTSLNFIKNLIEGFKYSSKNNPEYGNMLAGGAFIRFGQNLAEDRGAHVKRIIAEGIDKDSILDSEHKVKAAFGYLWDRWVEVGERSESITRAELYRQTYRKLIAEGHDADRAHFEAAYIAKDSMDFTLGGRAASIRLISQVVPFWNSRTQGLYKLARGAHDDPKRFAAVIGGVTLATIGLTLAYRDDKQMSQRSEWEKDNYWSFRIGDKIFRLPKPFEIGAMATVIDRGLEMVLDGMNQTSRERFVSRLRPIIDNQLNMNPTPQAIAPLLQLWSNKSWFTEKSIETEREQNLPVSERIGANTSAVAQLVGKAGVLSPQQVDHLVNAYLGWAGNIAVATADLALRPMMGLPDKPTMRINDYFLVGNFVQELPDNQSRFVEQYYTHLRDIQQSFADLRLMQQTGQFERAAEVMRENKQNLQLHGLYLHVSREIGKVNQRMRWVRMRTDPSPTNPNGMTAEQKRQEIDRLSQLRNRLAEVAETARANVVNR
jgi:hypothetical protein